MEEADRNAAARFTLIASGRAADAGEFAREVRAGMTASPKSLPCRFFYDAAGSRLFEEITELPEYYLTRAEREILRRHSPAIAGRAPVGAGVVELGCGSCAKTRLLLEAFLEQRGGLKYAAVDICATTLERSSLELLERYPALEIVGVAAEYRAGLRDAVARIPAPRLFLFLGSNIGNFTRPAAAEFVRDLRGMMDDRDALLIGIDLRKDEATLRRAYDDPKGITAKFNLNLLARINRELGGRFDLAAFRHRMEWNETEGRVEMYIDSVREQTVRIEALNLEVKFGKDEAIHTENSYKYSPEEIEGLAGSARMRVEERWVDEAGRFELSWIRRL